MSAQRFAAERQALVPPQAAAGAVPAAPPSRTFKLLGPSRRGRAGSVTAGDCPFKPFVGQLLFVARPARMLIRVALRGYDSASKGDIDADGGRVHCKVEGERGR